MVAPGLDLASVADELATVAGTFAHGELAYLAVTSKVELPLRDRLAWSLHSKLWPSQVVAREWKRTDLAVLDPSGLPRLLLEAKAMYSFDGCSEATWAKYSGYLQSDTAKARALAVDGTTAFLLLLVTDVDGDLERAPHGAVKYSDSLKRMRRRLPGPGAIRTACSERVRTGLEQAGPVARGSIDGGEAFGLAVNVDYWLVEI